MPTQFCERADIIAQMQFAGRTHAAEHALPLVRSGCHQSLKRMEVKNTKHWINQPAQKVLHPKIPAAMRAETSQPCRRLAALRWQKMPQNMAAIERWNRNQIEDAENNIDHHQLV